MYYIYLIFYTIPRLSSVLSTSLFDALILSIRMMFFLLFKKIRKDTIPWKFNFVFEDKPFPLQLFEGSTDIAAIKEIFLDGEYAWDAIISTKIIIDIGAHTGNTALYFHAKYPTAKIYAIEASSKNFHFLTQNVDAVPEIIPIHCAVSDKDGMMTFYESESSLGSSLRNQSNGYEVLVPSMTLKTLFNTIGITYADFIKIDIEGGEAVLFNKLQPDVFAQSYIIEIHDDYMDIKREQFLQHFSNFSQSFLKTPNKSRVILRAIVK